MSSRSRTPLIIGIVIVVVAAAAIAAVLATRGGDDDDDAAAPSASIVDYGKVSVTGDPLPQVDGPDDPAIGTTVPTVSGTDYDGNPVTIAPGKDGPLMIVVMAHWCPHCNREVPLLVDWKSSGNVPDGLRVVGVSTAVASDRPNYPPGEWLDGIGWDWPVIADDEQQTAAFSLGTTGYPFLMFVGADGNLIYRISAELPIADVQQLADQAAATV